jgi:hypothetical protein
MDNNIFKQTKHNNLALLNTLPSTLAPYSTLSRGVYDLVEQPQRVFFSIYDTLAVEGEDAEVTNDMVVHYPDIHSLDALIHGECVFVINDAIFSPEVIQSDILINPTWKDVLNCCNTLLGACKTHATGFLQNIIHINGNEYEFVLKP